MPEKITPEITFVQSNIGLIKLSSMKNRFDQTIFNGREV